MSKKYRTTMQIDLELWKRFLGFVVRKHGTTKKMSFELEFVMAEYVEKREGVEYG